MGEKADVWYCEVAFLIKKRLGAKIEEIEIWVLISRFLS